MVENTAMSSVVTNLIVGNIRNYVLQYDPACERLAMQSCKSNNAAAVNGLAVRVAELLRACWIDDLEAQEKRQGRTEEQIVADECTVMMQNPVIRMHVDCACFQLAAMIISSIVCGPDVRKAANECLNHLNLKA